MTLWVEESKSKGADLRGSFRAPQTRTARFSLSPRRPVTFLSTDDPGRPAALAQRHSRPFTQRWWRAAVLSFDQRPKPVNLPEP
jgi:hypothetical protein